MSLSRAVLSMPRLASRTGSRRMASSSPNSPIEPLKEKFGSETSEPIYIKGGSMDRVLFGATAAACLAATALNFKTYINFAFK